jgi:hypothetical protein
MKYAIVPATAGALMLAAAAIDVSPAQTSDQTIPPRALEATKAPLKLSEQDKAAVIRAAMDAKSRQKTPKDFTPEVGATVPKALYLHAFKPEVVGEIPALKQYDYAYLDKEIVLINSLQKKVVEVIPLPEKYVSGDPEHHGAADSEKTAPQGDRASTTGSVPAYTSPETIK